MIQIISPPGELRKRARQKNILNDAMQLMDHQGLADIEILTLTQWVKEKAYDAAWAVESDVSKIERKAILLQPSMTLVREFVQVDNERIKVGVNSEEVDERAIYKAICMITQVTNITNKQFTEFGEEVKVYAV